MGLEVSAVNAVPVSKLCVICWFFLRPDGPFNRSNHRITGRAGAQWGRRCGSRVASSCAVGCPRGQTRAVKRQRLGEPHGATREVCRRGRPTAPAGSEPQRLPSLVGRAAWTERGGRRESWRSGDRRNPGPRDGSGLCELRGAISPGASFAMTIGFDGRRPGTPTSRRAETHSDDRDHARTASYALSLS